MAANNQELDEILNEYESVYEAISDPRIEDIMKNKEGNNEN